MPTARGRVIRDQLLANREEARAERAAGGAVLAASEDPNQNQPRGRTREELESKLAADRAARRAAHKERNERAARAEAAALRESQQERTERLRRNRLNRSDSHRQTSRRAMANEASEREQLNRRRAAELTGEKGGVRVGPGDFRHGEQGQRVRKDKASEPQENKDAGADQENKDDKLAGVRFASPTAKARAEELGLEAGNFKRRRATGKTGFTQQDVDRIGKLAHEGDEGEDEDAEGGDEQ